MSETPAATSQPLSNIGTVDVNVHVSRWPFRRLPLDETPALATKLRQLGVSSAWCGSFDALLHRDIGAVNARLFDTCRDGAAAGLFVPFGTVNPMFPDWQEDLRRCHEVFRMPGIRLYPNYHGYKLDAPEFSRLIDMATQRRLVVQIAVSMEDQRVQLPLVRVPPVDLAPLPEVLQGVAAARVILLNALRGPRGGPLSLLAKTAQVSFDIATLENVGGVSVVLEHLPVERLLYGSHAPFFYPEAAAMKLMESPVPPPVAQKLRRDNAARILNWE